MKQSMKMHEAKYHISHKLYNKHYTYRYIIYAYDIHIYIYTWHAMLHIRVVVRGFGRRGASQCIPTGSSEGLGERTSKLISTESLPSQSRMKSCEIVWNHVKSYDAAHSDNFQKRILHWCLPCSALCVSDEVEQNCMSARLKASFAHRQLGVCLFSDCDSARFELARALGARDGHRDRFLALLLRVFLHRSSHTWCGWPCGWLLQHPDGTESTWTWPEQ